MIHDLRSALRALRRAPGFVLAAVLTLGLAIGAITAIFSVVNGVLLTPLPYQDPDRLQAFFEQSPASVRLPAYLTFLDYQAQARSFSGMGYIIGQSDVLRTEQGTVSLGQARVSDGFLKVMGAVPFMGRLIGPEDERPGASPVAVITYDFWRRQFASDPGILGRVLKTGNGALTVVGVLPPGAGYPNWVKVYAPLSAGTLPVAAARRDVHVDGAMIARLKPGVSLDRANEELALLGRRFAEAYPAENAGFRGVIIPIENVIVDGSARQPLLILLAAAFLLLVIACVNVTNLTLARITERTREMALRTALGAGRGRLLGQLLMETVLLAVLGAGLGLLIASWLVHLITASGGGNLLASGLGGVRPRLEEIRLDGRVFGVALGVTLLSGLAAGLAPALAGSRPDLAGMLKQAGPRGGRGRGSATGRRSLIALQAGLALALMVVSALLINSLWRLSRVDRGFHSEGLLTVHVKPSPRYSAPDSDIATLYQRLAGRVRGIPGVTSVGVINHLPMAGPWTGTRVGIDGGVSGEGQELTVGLRAADEAYLATMGIPLIRGRWFGANEMTRTLSGGIVINQAMAERYWPNQDALGHRVSFFKAASGRADFGQPLEGTVVGVVGNVRQFGLDRPSDAAIYIPYTVDPWGHSYLVIRTGIAAASLLEPVRRALIAEEPEVVLDQINPMDDVVAGSLVGREFLAVLVAVFAVSALGLAMIGLYGVLSRLVQAREREIGIRRAVGADERAIVGLVMREGALAVGSGIVLGVGMALALSRVIGSQLYGVSSIDPVTYVVTLLLLVSVALVACYLPARRAARIDPTVALQGD